MTDIVPILTVVHLFGVVIGAGGAFVSDLMFLSSVADERFSPTELRFLKIGSRTVWTGVAILACSGLLMFSTDPAAYAASDKFLAKMTVVGIIIMNGIVFHLRHIPLIMRHADQHFPSSDEFIRMRPYILASGALSGTSWLTAIVLGASRSLPFSYAQIITAYAVVVATAIIVAVSLRDAILPHHHVRHKLRQFFEWIASKF